MARKESSLGLAMMCSLLGSGGEGITVNKKGVSAMGLSAVVGLLVIMAGVTGFVFVVAGVKGLLFVMAGTTGLLFVIIDKKGDS